MRWLKSAEVFNVVYEDEDAEIEQPGDSQRAEEPAYLESALADA
jgi:hypothetical protein